MSPTRSILSPGLLVFATLLGSAFYCLGRGGCALLSPDRQAYSLFGNGDYADAARLFADPLWRAAALFRQGEFEQAAGIWAGVASAEGLFNHGNALLMQGRYRDAAQR